MPVDCQIMKDKSENRCLFEFYPKLYNINQAQYFLAGK